MKQELINKIRNEHPNMFKQSVHIECEDGWCKLITALCDTIEWEINNNIPSKSIKDIYVVQIKNKFGGLRVHFNQTTPFIDGAIQLAEEISNFTCELCGNCGSHRVIDNWYWTLCDLHLLEMTTKDKIHCVSYISGTKIWYKDNQYHRENGPAVEDANGDKEWWLNGQRHRVGGPAIEKLNGTKIWYQNNLLHREDGPAVEQANGGKQWWVNNKMIHCSTQKEFERLIKLKVFW